MLEVDETPTMEEANDLNILEWMLLPEAQVRKINMDKK
jgi:hypothetical protein